MYNFVTDLFCGNLHCEDILYIYLEDVCFYRRYFMVVNCKS